MEKIKNFLKSAVIEEYRSIPFWSWNDKLEPEELRKQIRWMKEQGFGGYFMHARGGLITEYLGDDWFECVSACVDEGEKVGMESWAYDENGWPSGFVGGKLLSDPENCDRYLTYSFGKYDEKALVSYIIDGERLIRSKGGDKGEYLNVYEHYSVSTADILNPEVVDKFINETHEKYKARLGKDFNKKLKGFFTDEPQYQRWNHAYTKVLPAYYKKLYGEDLFDGLGLMFVEKEGYRTFRYRYWKAMQSLMLENFAKKLYNWCDKNGVKLTGHYVEETSLEYQNVCCGGVMPFYEYEHIPGMDHLGRDVSETIAPKQVASVSAQLGKKKILTESFACCGWDVSPLDLKRVAESQYVHGVNYMCQHLMPYSEHGQRKRDYPAHFSWSNPWVRKNFKGFNDYFARLGALLGESRENVNVALFCPMRSVYFDFKRELFQEQKLDADISYMALANKLAAMNIPFHIIDETVMEKHGGVSGAKLCVGECKYDFVIFPLTYTMGVLSKELFDKYYACGGKMLFTEGLPEYLEGEKNEYDFDTNVTLEEIAAAQEYSVNKYDTDVKSTIREIDGKKFIFAANVNGDKDYTIKFSGNFNSFVKLDLETLETEKTGTEILFRAGDSFVLFLSDERVENAAEKPEIAFTDNFEVLNDSGNYFTLDKLSYSFDGVNYSQPLRYMGVFNELLNKRHEGAVFLKYDFKVKSIPETVYFLAEDMHNEYCEINGNRIDFTGESDFESKIYKADVKAFVKEGVNSAVIKINFYESEKVYYALFGENVTESIKNCLAYDTTIEACYLQGDFGVYSETGFTKGKEKNVLIGDDFYISGKKSVINDTVKDGFPFFAGNMTLGKKFTSDGKPAVLKLSGNFCLCDITINGKKVNKSYFARRVDITPYITAGENYAEITLYSGNRNLLGPFHLKSAEEAFFVGIDTYELVGTWKDGKSSEERDDYSFVRFGLFE